LSALGDIVHTWPLACAIAASKTRPHLSWVVEEPLKTLVEGHPAVDATFTTRTGRWRRRPWAASTRSEVAGFKTRLRELQPDLVIDPQGTTKSAMVVRWSGAERRVGLARPWRRERLAGLAYTDTVRGAPGQAHIVATNLAMVAAVGAKIPELSPPDGSWLLDRVGDRAPTGDWSTPYAVVLPGAGGAHKVHTESTLTAVARGLAANGLADLEELAGLLGGAALVLGGDTGPVHLAASFGSPTLAVFLASNWRRNGPLGDHTAVVSGAADAPTLPSGTARTRPQREVGAAEILESARGLLVR
jgi:heptosyltransferase-1